MDADTKETRAPSPRRPLGVTLVSWYALVFGPITILSTVFAVYELWFSDDPALMAAYMDGWKLPPAFQMAQGLVMGAIHIVSGWYMLRGRRWARNLMLAALAAGFAIYLYDSPFVRGGVNAIAIAQVAFVVLLVFLLCNRRARAYFGG